MSNAYELGAVQYEAEAAWGEDVTTFATLRWPVLDAVDCSNLKQDKIDPQRVNQYLQDGQPHILGAMSGTFKTRFHATGHGSSTAGATTADAMEVVLSYIFSGGGAGGAGGTPTVSSATGTTATGGTAATPTTAAANGFVAGGGCRIGAQNDGRGNGRAAIVSSHAGSSLALLTALHAAPNNGDIVYSGTNLYLPETPTSSAVTSIRLLVLTANLRYELHGVWPMSVSLKGTNPSERPFWEIEWGVSWWRMSTAAFPSVVATNTYTPAPVAGASLFVNDVGSSACAAANERVFKQLEVMIKLGIQPIMGSGGVNQYQAVIGCRRTPTDIRIRWIEDADAATLTSVLDGYFTGSTSKHILATLSTINGSSVAIYAPNARIVGSRPTQKQLNKINSLSIEAECNTGPTLTTDLTASALRVFYS